MSTTGRPQRTHGDYYAASQAGGHAGGHSNTNTIVNDGTDTFEDEIASIKARLAANTTDEAGDWTSLARLAKMKKELNSLLSKVGELQDKIQEKLPS